MGPSKFSGLDRLGPRFWRTHGELPRFGYPAGWVERIEADRRQERIVALGGLAFTWWVPRVARRLRETRVIEDRG